MKTSSLILMTTLILAGFCQPGRADSDLSSTVEWRFHFPLVEDYLVLGVRECQSSKKNCEIVSTCREIEIYGDGRVDVTPPFWSAPVGALRLSDEHFEILLRSLEPLLLGDGTLPASEAAAIDGVDQVELHLERVVGHHGWDEREPIHLIRRTDLPRAIFSEVHRLARWLHLNFLKSRHALVWTSNIDQFLCSLRGRQEMGLAMAKVPWCKSSSGQIRFEDASQPPLYFRDDPDREAIRERLRERLRSLPRGLKNGEGDESCPSEEQPIDLRPSSSGDCVWGNRSES